MRLEMLVLQKILSSFLLRTSFISFALFFFLKTDVRSQFQAYYISISHIITLTYGHYCYKMP